MYKEKMYSIDEISKIFIGENDKGGLFDDWLDYRLETKNRITFKEWFIDKDEYTLKCLVDKITK